MHACSEQALKVCVHFKPLASQLMTACIKANLNLQLVDNKPNLETKGAKIQTMPTVDRIMHTLEATGIPTHQCIKD